MKVAERGARIRSFSSGAIQDQSLDGDGGQIFYVYVLASKTAEHLAVSMTQDLVTRVQHQKNDLHPRDFTSVHAIHSLVCVERFDDICRAIERYNLLRSMDRESLSWLVSARNPGWEDLYGDYLN